MSGLIWMFSDKIDAEDIEILQKEYLTVPETRKYYGFGEKPFRRAIAEAGAIYRVGTGDTIRRMVIRVSRARFEEYLRYKNRKSE